MLQCVPSGQKGVDDDDDSWVMLLLHGMHSACTVVAFAAGLTDGGEDKKNGKWI